MLRNLGCGAIGACGRIRSRCWIRIRGPKLNPRLASDPASRDRHATGHSCDTTGRHRYSTGQSCHATRWYCNTACGNGEASDRAGESKHSRYGAQHYSESNHAGINFACNADSGKHHAAFDNQSEYPEHAR